MKNRGFIFSKSDLIKLVAMIIISSLFFGVSGLLMILFLKWFTLHDHASSEDHTHGISHLNPSRFGGLAIFLCIVLIVITGDVKDIPNVSLRSLQFDELLMCSVALLCGLVGLVEDIKNNTLNAKVRVIAKSAIFAIAFCLSPKFIPQSLGVELLDIFLEYIIFAFVVIIIFCVGFVNAVNMADGANGLIAGTMTIVFSLFFLESGSFLHAAVMMSCFLFTIFNVISGRLFLGDMGSYGLGALAVMNALLFFEDNVFSLGFFASLFCYPCIDFVTSICRRMLSKQPVFLPDNDHLHNRLYFYLRERTKSQTLSNSLTGLLIVFFSSGLTLIIFLLEIWSVNSNYWFILFASQWGLYLFAFLIFAKNEHVSKYILDEQIES